MFKNIKNMFKTKKIETIPTKEIVIEKKVIKKIVIVDDVIIMATNMKKYLELKKYDLEIICLSNGIECIKYCEEHDDIDLIFMDLIMGRPDGYETSEIILNRPDNKIIIVAMTGMIERESILRCKKIGILDVFEKPVDYEDVIKKLAFFGLTIAKRD